MTVKWLLWLLGVTLQTLTYRAHLTKRALFGEVGPNQVFLIIFLNIWLRTNSVASCPGLGNQLPVTKQHAMRVQWGMKRFWCVTCEGS